MFTVDIDTGGTMTDALVSDGKEIRAFKVDTTPHDYAVYVPRMPSRSGDNMDTAAFSPFSTT